MPTVLNSKDTMQMKQTSGWNQQKVEVISDVVIEINVA